MRFCFRVLALFALAVAVVLAVIDATRSVAASRLVMTPLAESWRNAAPETLETARGALGAWWWDTLAAAVLAQPGFVVFAVLALVLYAIGHRPRRLRRAAPFEP